MNDQNIDNNNEFKISEEEDKSPKKKSGLFSGIFYASAFVIVPLFLLLALLYTQLTYSDFYTSILKKADFIESYVSAEKWHVEEKIKKEIEDKVHLEKYRIKYESIKAEYEKKVEEFKKFNKSDEYERLKEQRQELSDLSYQRAPSKIKNPEDFKKYKESELEKLDKQIADIDEYRDSNEDAIEKMEDELEDLEDAYEDAEDTLKDKEEEAQEIVLSHEDSFKGQIYSDLSKISPVLTEELNTKLIDKGIKTEIEKLISFFCSYYKQKNSGNVYSDMLDDFITGRTNNVRVKFPEISVSLWVEDEVNGVQQKRHILSEIFIDRIKEIKELKNRNVFLKLFKFSESGMAEMIGQTYFNKLGLSINNGIIKIKSREISGTSAKVIQGIMIAFTWGSYLKYLFLIIAVIIFIFLIVSDNKAKHKRIKNILIYPSSLILIACFALIILSRSVLAFFPGVIESPVARMYLHSLLSTAAIHLTAPSIILFLLLFIIGILLRKKAS